MPLIHVFLTYMRNLLHHIVKAQLIPWFMHRHLRKREFEKFLRNAFGLSRKNSVKWAKYVK